MYNFLVSVVVPMYNVENYIVKCLESLRLQSLKSIEVIIVNDGSTDESRLIAEKYINENFLNDRFKIVDKLNGGLSDARNYGLDYCSGKYVAFLDSDDYVENNAYELMYDNISNSNGLVIQTSYFMTYDKKEKIINVEDYQSISNYAAYGIVVAWNKMFDLDFIKRNKLLFPVGLYYEDVFFFYSFLEKIEDFSKVVTIKVPLIHYVQRKSSIMTTKSKKLLDIITIYEKLKDNKLSKEIEYRCSRNLNASFRLKARKIKNKLERKMVINKFDQYLLDNYPNWKKNIYYKKTMGNFVIKYIMPFLK